MGFGGGTVSPVDHSCWALTKVFPAHQRGQTIDKNRVLKLADGGVWSAVNRSCEHPSAHVCEEHQEGKEKRPSSQRCLLLSEHVHTSHVAGRLAHL